MRMWKRKTARIRFILLAGFMIFVTVVCRSVNGRQETSKRTDEGIELCHEIKEVIDQEAMGRAMEGETPEVDGVYLTMLQDGNFLTADELGMKKAISYEWSRAGIEYVLYQPGEGEWEGSLPDTGCRYGRGIVGIGKLLREMEEERWEIR